MTENTFQLWKQRNGLDASWPYLTREAKARAIVRCMAESVPEAPPETPPGAVAVHPRPLCMEDGCMEFARRGLALCEYHEMFEGPIVHEIDEDEALRVAARVRARIARETANKRAWDLLAERVMRPSLWDRVAGDVRGHPVVYAIVGCGAAFGVFHVWCAR